MVQQGMTFQHKQPLKKRLWKARWFYLLMLPGDKHFKTSVLSKEIGL